MTLVPELWEGGHCLGTRALVTNGLWAASRTAPPPQAPRSRPCAFLSRACWYPGGRRCSSARQRSRYCCPFCTPLFSLLILFLPEFNKIFFFFPSCACLHEFSLFVFFQPFSCANASVSFHNAPLPWGRCQPRQREKRGLSQRVEYQLSSVGALPR